MAPRTELLEATDESIAEAVKFADPMALRGLLYQLTGDESLAHMRVADVARGIADLQVLADKADVAAVRSKAPGDKVTLTYLDPSGKPQTVQVTLGKAQQ